MSRLNVLVVGAGIAGSVVAYWLAKAGVDVTVIERSPELRTSGQGIDIRGIGIDVIRKMGVEGAIKSQTTEEAGTIFVDEDNNSLATFGLEGSQGLTAEIEIIRSDLAKILYDASLSVNVSYEFGTSITSLRQTATKAVVELSNHQTRDFDLVIAADGFSSRTRSLILGTERSKAAVKSFNAFVGYFTMPLEEQDAPYSRWLTIPGRRAATLRPRSKNQTSAYLTVFSDGQAVREARDSGDIKTQQAFLTKTFSEIGWEVPRMLRELPNAGSDDFYFQEVGQIHLPTSSWHQGRCALVGDAGYCPSPFTGMGTTLAIVGAYVLAGEIVAQLRSTSASDPNPNPNQDFEPELAFKKYEDVMGDYVKTVQKIPLGGMVPYLLNPETTWGVWILRTVLWLVDRSGVLRWPSLIGEQKTDGIDLSHYSF